MSAPVVLGIVSYKIFPQVMGGQQCAAGFYQQLSKEAKVVLAASKENAITDTGNILLYPFLFDHWKGWLNVFRLYRLSKLVKQHTVDVILLEHSYFGWIGIALKRLTGKPFAIRSHNIEALRFRDMRRSWWWLYELYERWVHRKADHNFFITEEDKLFAINKWRLAPLLCSLATCGTGIRIPPADERQEARKKILDRYALPGQTRLFFFNGTLDYVPNIDALRVILNELLSLLQPSPVPFRIIISGDRISHQWRTVLEAHRQIIFTGFVTDVDLFFKGADCFINPVTLGGGIKTKLITALAHNQPVISTRSGARGFTSLPMERLIVVDDYDWQGFTDAMLTIDFTRLPPVPALFYTHFSWPVIIQQALVSLRAL